MELLLALSLLVATKIIKTLPDFKEWYDENKDKEPEDWSDPKDKDENERG